MRHSETEHTVDDINTPADTPAPSSMQSDSFLSAQYQFVASLASEADEYSIRDIFF
ncbi:hypothetical protein VA7868_00182 [Vibrio aerogenes CECT 7868]|uniref:Uncharacterized protein n=1 Tax=Vibrio aerogenes CECT 7868 TaxID=1216006 RepID=A0A1M5UVP3_9VIBR|nr:hypothetical protein [Vibrio aerogenes]SHH66783.1 hypothetical protein VA7868_00182 [Vibrio aerogenes CECT 7868]